MSDGGTEDQGIVQANLEPSNQHYKQLLRFRNRDEVNDRLDALRQNNGNARNKPRWWYTNQLNIWY